MSVYIVRFFFQYILDSVCSNFHRTDNFLLLTMILNDLDLNNSVMSKYALLIIDPMFWCIYKSKHVLIHCSGMILHGKLTRYGILY